MSEYSTRGGTSAYTSRCTMPSSSSSRRCELSTFSVTPGTARRNSPKRQVRSFSAHRMSTFHLPPITSIAASIPQTKAPGRRTIRIARPPTWSLTTR